MLVARTTSGHSFLGRPDPNSIHTLFIPVDPSSNHIVHLANAIRRSPHLEPLSVVSSTRITRRHVRAQSHSRQFNMDQTFDPAAMRRHSRRTTRPRPVVDPSDVRIVAQHFNVVPTLPLPLVHSSLYVCRPADFEQHRLLAGLAAGIGKGGHDITRTAGAGR